MINLNGTEYKLLLVDTNIISEVIKNEHQEFRTLMEWYTSQRIVICFSFFTILEIRKTPALYKQFLKLFSVIPCVFLKSHEQLLQDEVSCYPDYSNINPVLLGFPSPLAKAKLHEVLEQAFKDSQIIAREEYWNSSRESIVEGIKGLIKNFPPKGDKYTKKEIREFVRLAGLQQIGLRQPEFFKASENSRRVIDVNSFPSIKITSLVVFYKFYVDSRKPLISDAFDILIFSSIPYVDLVISEKHLVSLIKKIKAHDKFINHVDMFDINYLRS